MTKSKSIIHRDQIHGDVHYDPLSVALLNSETLQRLGRVYQLGYSHLVFRGGTHTRLSHVMGATHVAGQIVDFLRRNYKQGRAARPNHVSLPNDFLPNPPRKEGLSPSVEEAIESRWSLLRHFVTWAALLHDVGHIPLGHTLEDEFDGIFKKHDDLSSPRSPHLWDEQSEIFRILTDASLYPESFRDFQIGPALVWETVLLICFFKDKKTQNTKKHPFEEYLGKEEDKAPSEGPIRPFIRDLTRAFQNENRLFQPYMADIVANTICADYLDYVKRDPLNVGLDVLRDERILSHFYVSKQERINDLRMALALLDRHGKPRLDVCTGVVEQVRQRYRFAELIYYHKTKVAASAMFAKAMAFIGKPTEIPTKNTVLNISDERLSDLAKNLAKRKSSISELRDTIGPNALLSTEIGDDSLHLLLMQTALTNVESAIDERTLNPDVRLSAIEDNLRGLALLQGISRRKLYKVSVALTAEQFGRVTKGAVQSRAAEDRLKHLIAKLRNEDADDEASKETIVAKSTKEPPLRSMIERKMAAAVGWPEGSVLLYVPPRKNQAKGIDTFAFDSEGVVRLNEHPVVSEKVNELSRDYEKLWRLLVLTHPDYEQDSIRLSEILDELIRSLWSEDLFGADLHDEARVHQLRDIARFSYIRSDHREAARFMQMLAAEAGQKVDWGLFERASVKTAGGQRTFGSREYAERCFVLQRIRDSLNRSENAERDAINLMQSRFPYESSLSGLKTNGRMKKPSNMTLQKAKARAQDLEEIAKKILQSKPRKTEAKTQKVADGVR